MSKQRYRLSDLTQFFTAFRAESDRACAILGRALLEEHLGRLFSASFVPGVRLRELLDGQGPLATFSARIRVAEALGWIAVDEAADLHLIREIGNDFAHGLDHSMSFDERSIRDRTLALQSPRILLDYSHLSDKPLLASEIDDFRTRPRRRFELAVGILWAHLSRRAADTAPATGLQSLLTLLDAHPDARPPSA